MDGIEVYKRVIEIHRYRANRYNELLTNLLIVLAEKITDNAEAGTTVMEAREILRLCKATMNEANSVHAVAEHKLASLKEEMM